MIGAGGEEGGARARAGSLEEVGNNNMFLRDFSMSLTQIFICLTLINKKTPNDNNLKINGLLGPLAHQPPSHLTLRTSPLVHEAGHNSVCSMGLKVNLTVYSLVSLSVVYIWNNFVWERKAQRSL